MSKAKLIGSSILPLLALLGPSAAEATLVVPTLPNPGFEQDGTGAAAPSGWVSSGSTNADFTEPGGHSGNFRLSHWSADPYLVDTRQTLSGLATGWYTLRAWVKRSAGQNDSYVELSCGQRRERVYLPVSWADQWLQVVASTYVDRRSCTITLHTEAAGGEWSNFDDVELVPGAGRLSVLGADVSSLTKSEALGGEYFDDFSRPDHCGAEQSALDILKGHGASHVRVRVWVDPADGYHDITEAKSIARRARAAGLKVLADLHYSDTWADPGHQAKPAAWASHSVEQLRQDVYRHTYDVCKAMTVYGKGPDMMQIGNELNAGMLWPDGHTYDPPNWDNLAGFLTAGYQAVKACSPSTKVMLHLANGGDNGLYRWWFDNITQRNVPFDVIGFSYYGYWHGSLGDLQRNLNDVSARYGKDVVVAETAYPFTLGFEDNQSNAIGLESQLVPGYPASPEGQARNLRDVLSIVRAVPNGRGLGAFYWDATWTAVPGNGWDPADPNSGDTWENQALFDFDDVALPAMDEFRP
ncbi:MAG TPA: arabinogalactan endo-1,4-beta-galactosidase [Polyangiaceae bacterium]|nr:arabinogalactan endo-1,4-beta-galactosidase [Polyangiaceae bacterium]